MEPIARREFIALAGAVAITMLLPTGAFAACAKPICARCGGTAYRGTRAMRLAAQGRYLEDDFCFSCLKSARGDSALAETYKFFALD
jgi:hypothetical protein